MVRILGVNDFGEWPNDVLFCLTSNNLTAGRDLVSRNLTIDLYTEGDPKQRHSQREASDPVEYAEEHRAGILGELAAMVLRWVDAGRPNGELNTRFNNVSRIVGGILDVNGFPGFASNAEAAAIEMDDELQRMLELAEEIAGGAHGEEVVVRRGEDATKAGRVAGDWIGAFEQLGLIDVRHQQEATTKSKSSRVGKLFSSYIDRSLTVESGGRRWVVTIRKRPASGNKTFYYAEVEAIEATADCDAVGLVDGDAQSATETATSTTAVVAPPRAPLASAAASAASPAGWMSAAAALANPGAAPGEAVE